MTSLILLRHGETEFNREQRFVGSSDVPLNERGREQARRCAQRLADEPVAAVYASCLSRARETAEIIARPHGLGVRADARLNEADFGSWEGCTAQEVVAMDSEGFQMWQRNLRDPGDGETRQEVMTRAIAALEDLLKEHPDQTVVVVSHVLPLKAIIAHALGLSVDSFRRIHSANCALNMIRFEGDRLPRLMKLNEDGFLRGVESTPFRGLEAPASAR